MPASLMQPASLLYFLTSDPQVVGAVTWFGLFVTIAGFWIAIAQLRKVKSSSVAAAEAVASLTKIVRSQEQSTKISSALVSLTSAQAMMRRGNSDAAAAHLYGAWTALVAAREMTVNDVDRDLVSGFVLSTRQLYDDINTPTTRRSTFAETTARRHTEISKVIGELVIFSARLDAALLGTGFSA